MIHPEESKGWAMSRGTFLLLLCLIHCYCSVGLVFGSTCPKFQIPAEYEKLSHPGWPTDIFLEIYIEQVQSVDDLTLSFQVDVRKCWNCIAKKCLFFSVYSVGPEGSAQLGIGLNIHVPREVSCSKLGLPFEAKLENIAQDPRILMSTGMNQNN